MLEPANPFFGHEEPALDAKPSGWQAAPALGLEAAIAEFKACLPGWWFSICECQVSCDASCAPTTDSPDIALIGKNPAFDLGFHVDLLQPSTLAAALRHVMRDALAAKAVALGKHTVGEGA